MSPERPAPPSNWLRLACPVCRHPLESQAEGGLICSQDGNRFCRENGIWRFLTPEREQHFAQFIQEYETVRMAEGRGSPDPAYYRSLPFADLTGRWSADWRVRTRSFATLIGRIIQPLEGRKRRALQIADLGAGNGWLSYQLARRGHRVAAVDLSINPLDGLGAYIHYEGAFVPVQAEFDALPFDEEQFDAVIFNASLHYSMQYKHTLGEARHVLYQDGTVIITDTPIYHDGASGLQMVHEREAHFREMVGFPSNALQGENFLTHHRLDELGELAGVRWRLHWPVPAWRRAIRRLRAHLRGQREPAQFPVIEGRR